ncbi:hypothetical protein [Bosea sp. (in: a-proteobacteria)]|uniref:hypothetical protein n=1 Tax=Bosea sp. (in: a-proteobacteria) TaxID=1871050 RepID=UPI002638CF95|nr:hypothetical protein [Bosea sp. (in: a-proteobacteria)]MCO5092060.1 hypothetical protein [Bosea sp. (in: a-proteobacteria)]
MRAVVTIGLLFSAVPAAAQEKAITFSDLEANRGRLAGDVVRVEGVTVFGFSEVGGGLVRDRTGGAKLAAEGITPRMIYHLERNCSRASMTPAKPECQGTLKFKVTLREDFRGGLTIREAEFVPNRQ